MVLLPLRYVDEQAGGRYPPAPALGLVYGELQVHARIRRTPAVKLAELLAQQRWYGWAMGADHKVDFCFEWIHQPYRPVAWLQPSQIPDRTKRTEVSGPIRAGNLP